MALETCNASVFHDVDGTIEKFNNPKQDRFPGENITNFKTIAQRLIKLMMGDFSWPTNSGSKLLTKVSNSSSEYFN
jgi:hypothetical protein